MRTLVRIALALVLCAGVRAISAVAPRFYPDDPIWVEDDRALDASKVGEVEDTNAQDFVINTFVRPGEHRDIRALNINTVDEVPDSSWFTNRIGRGGLSIAELVRGPDRIERLSLDGWVVSSGKPTGLQPGFRMKDPAGQTYQIEFDPPSNPEMATGAEVIGTAFYYAMGYHTVEVYVTTLDPRRLVIAPTAKIFDPLLRKDRPYTRYDVDNVLARGARRADGTYRVLASRFASGTPLGNFRYYGTRPDDPNDIYPHEHRRELRGARVFGAWLNHDDSRGVNSLDLRETANGRGWVKHYMFDFGSIMGSGTAFAQRHRAGNEYIFESRPGWLTLATLGLYTRPWMHIPYPDVPPAVGRFEGDKFDPLRWKPEYPNPAFDNMRADDAFWAARIVSRFSDSAIRAIVDKAQYSDPRASQYIADTLIKRRDKVLRAWLTHVNPLVDFEISSAGELTFANAAVTAGLATPAASYTVRIARFDNATGTASPVSTTDVPQARVALPADLRATPAGGYLEIQIGAAHADYPSWRTPVTVHMRRTTAGWTTAGIVR